ncbi:TolC family protein [Geobacter sp.]|uniref:TolC family protein n=1 Tax=Geobacter sp. TaxID=46610 RepID=UPI00261F775A|nr:TolC family protein [Geobacter sp.]
MNDRADTTPASHFNGKAIRLLWQAILSLLLVAGTARGENAPDTMNLSRKSAIEMAIRRNVDLKNEILNSSIAIIDVKRSRGIYDPLFGISANGGVSYTPGDPFFRTKSGVASINLSQLLPTGGSLGLSTQSGFTTAEISTGGILTTDWQSSVGLSASQPLLRNAGKETTELTIILAENSQKDSAERLRLYITDTVLSVIQAYNRLYTLHQTLQSRLEALNSAQSLRDEIQTKMKAGKKQTLEIANAEYAITQRRKDLVDAERNVRDQEATLRYLIGMEAKTQIVPVDPPSREEPPETEEQAIKSALELRPDLKQLILSLQSNQLQERVARHQSLPDLTLSAGGGLTGNSDNFGRSFRQLGERPGTYWSVGMQFSVPIGNTALRNDYLRSKIRTEQAENQIKSLAWRIRNDVEADMRALISARLQMQTADTARQYAEQRREEYRKQGKAGTTTVQNVINADTDLTAARTAQLDAVETFSYTVAKLWRDIGVLLDHQGIRIDTAHPDKLLGGEGGPGTPKRQVEGNNIAPLTLQHVAFNAASPPPSASDSGSNLLAGHREEMPSGSKGEVSTAMVRGKAQRPAAAGEAASHNGGGDGRFTLKVGEYVAKGALEDARKKIAAAGLAATVEQGEKKPVQMLRLYFGEFSNEEAARKAVEKLRSLNAAPFVLTNEAHKYRVYAGSYLDRESAAEEQARLAGKGIKVSQVAAPVSLPSFVLLAGSFPTEEAAEKAAARLEQLGMKPTIGRNGR